MREILFKAKVKTKVIKVDIWVEGSYFFQPLVDEHFIVDRKGETYSIDINTLCQFTGLTDKNGNKIWENDIIGFLDTSCYDNGYAEYYCTGKVFWDEETLSFQVTERISCESYEALDGDCEVIGNKFDNAELLERGVEDWKD